MRRLIIRPGAIGDTILAFPAFEHLCANAEYSEIWVRSEVVPLVRCAGRVRAIASTGIELFGLPGVAAPPGLIAQLGSFEQIVTWYGANRPEFRAGLASFCKDVQCLAALPQKAAGRHAADLFLEQVGGSGVAVPRLRLPPFHPGDFVVLHPFSGGSAKNWPLNRFVELETRLRAAGYRVEWAAQPDWVRFENLADLANWLAPARAYIGNDSGITHLAAAAGVPVIALFGPTDPAVWGPRADPVRILRAASMDGIGISDVMRAVDEIARDAAAGQTAP